MKFFLVPNVQLFQFGAGAVESLAILSILHGVVWCDMVLYSVVWYDMVWYCVVWYDIV